MSSRVKSRRTYVSPRRTATAEATRAAILVASRALFLECGYAGTTIAAIADRASVSAKTVYARFGNKRQLLAAVLDHAIAGDAIPVPILERDWVRAMRDEDDRGKRLDLLAHAGAAILGRRTEVDELIRKAAEVDPDLGDLVSTSRTQRRAGQAELLRIALGEPPDEAAIDSLFALGSPEVYRLTVIESGWSHDRFVTWYATTIRRLFLDEEPRRA
jgi:AcrR family transcriptional regulator